MSERVKRWTPGPWVKGKSEEFGFNLCVDTGYDRSPTFTPAEVCSILPSLSDDGTVRGEEDEHNAHLIAAAPALVEALEDMLDGLEDALNDLGVCGLTAYLDGEDVQKAKAALALAYGETQ